MSQYFAARGYQLEVASELEQAEALLSNGTFDAVITALNKQLSDQQAIVVGNSPEQFKAEVTTNLERFKRAVAAANIRVE